MTESLIQSNRFTRDARNVTQRAVKIAQCYGHNQIDTEHLLLAIVEQPGEIIPRALGQLNIDIAQVYRRCLEMFDGIAPISTSPTINAEQAYATRHLEQTLKLAANEAAYLEDSRISIEHLFLGIICGVGHVAHAMVSMNITRKCIYDILGEGNISTEKLKGHIPASFYCFDDGDIYHVNLLDNPCCGIERQPDYIIENPGSKMQLCPNCKDTINDLLYLCKDVLAQDKHREDRVSTYKKELRLQEMETKYQEARDIAQGEIPEIRIKAAKHDIMHKGVRILSYTDSSHHMGHLLEYLINYEEKKPRNFAGLYWVEQTAPYMAWFHYTKGKKAYFHRPGKDKYLHSSEWEQKRQLVLDRDNNCCTECGSNISLCVHHKTYKHYGDEPLEDLVSLCQQCHEALHQEMSFQFFCPAYPELI